MIRMVARHKVNDADTFIAGYNAPEQLAIRESGGVMNDTVHLLVDDNNDVLITHDFDDLESAQAYLANPALAEAMQALGVAEEPNIALFTIVD
jgi:hypothetical protein